MLLPSVVCGSKMQVGIKSIIFVLWMCSFAQAQRECLQNEIQFANILRFSLDERYEWGDSVRVNCATGYVGFLKLTCTNEGWRQTGGRECKKRPCGHPGDTPNGDFTLKGETEFVFGAVVEYHCRKGYVMTSRVNRRNCLSQGWDNSVPVCEEVKCPTIKATGDVIASGNTEDASFEEVIHFECASSHKMLDGPETIHCTEHGTWSASVPKCKEISCQPPNINHGTISNFMEQYKENELIKYSCLGGFKPRPGVSKCTKYGWSIQPDCEEIICMLGPPTREVARTLPLGKNIFKMRDTVEVICSDGYRVIGTKVQSKVIMCGENGNWENTPTCEDITCEVPHGQHVYYPHYYFSYERRLGISRSYRCEAGYQQAAREATCQVDGWHPNPLCIKFTCSAPQIEHALMQTRAKQTYYYNDRIWLQCITGYQPESAFEITCSHEGKWTHERKCTAKAGSCSAVTLDDGFINYIQVQDATRGGRSQGFTYACNTGYKPFDGKWWGVVTCSNGAWTHQPQCIQEELCGSLPNVPHGKPTQTKEVYQEDQSVKYQCVIGYQSKPANIICNNGQWSIPVCEPDRCGLPPKVDNAVITSYSQQHGQKSATYKCKESYKMQGQEIISCKERWEEPPTCEIPTCPNPRQEIANAKLVTLNEENGPYRHKDTVEYKCNEGFEFQIVMVPGIIPGRATCKNTQWNYPTCVKKLQTCSSPEMEINNATLILEDTSDQKMTYNEGDTVNYRCKIEFQFSVLNESTATCRGANWVYPLCIAVPSQPCQNPKQLIDNGTLINTDGEDEVNKYVEGESVQYSCSEGYTFLHKDSTATCTGGNWSYPQCILQSDCEPPQQLGAAKPEGVENRLYKSGMSVNYTCPNFHVMDGGPHLTCEQGKWMGNVTCLRPCIVERQDLQNIDIIEGQGIVQHGTSITFRCLQGYKRKDQKIKYKQMCEDGLITKPQCIKRNP